MEGTSWSPVGLVAGSTGTVTVRVVGPGAHSVHTVTVVVHPSGRADTVEAWDTGFAGGFVVFSTGTVSVTVVGVAAHCVQTVTVVVQPSGTEGVDPVTEGGLVVAVAVAVPGQ